MRTFTRFIVAWAGVASMMAAGDRSVAAEPAQSAAQLSSAHAERLFALKIAPLIKRKCLGCHGEDANDLKGEFDVRSLSGLLKGGESGEPSLVPGQPEESPLFSAIKWEGSEMPPKEIDRLTAAEIELVRQWIAAGAPWPDDKRQAELRTAEWSIEQNEDGVLVKTSGGLSDEWTYRRYNPADLWSFRPVVAVAVPDGVHPIDWFLQQKLNLAGFEMTDEADPQTLIRRATYDLIGLPPTPGETESFVNAYRQNPERAWNQLIDRLLESPHYGERWGQHWLDVVRYADTGGLSNDFERSNMWRYRDYVIRAFNDDKPYNDFIVEQLAGDEMADESVRQRKRPDDKVVHQTRLAGDYTEQKSEWLVATCFLRIGPWDSQMIKQPEARQIYLDDLVNAVGQTFLSTTMRCLKCHDHKFDPLPTRDYYRMYAAFAATQMAEIHPGHADLSARMENYELAFRMQTAVPDVIELGQEPQHIQEMYGLDDPVTEAFGKQCLMARRLVENGVRFVQIFSGGWDSHDYLERGHTARIRSVDKPIAALIKDLKARGLLDDTLVVWTGEFGRTPDNNKRGGVYSLGRGHNADALTMLFAGGGVKPGLVGGTDELGASAVDCVHPIRDVHVTLLHLLGLDDNKLTYFHAGRFKQLSQFGGEVIRELIA